MVAEEEGSTGGAAEANDDEVLELEEDLTAGAVSKYDEDGREEEEEEMMMMKDLQWHTHLQHQHNSQKRKKQREQQNHQEEGSRTMTLLTSRYAGMCLEVNALPLLLIVLHAEDGRIVER